MGDRLTDAQQTAFTENGYLVLDGLLDAGECSALRDEVDALVRQRVLGEQPLLVSFRLFHARRAKPGGESPRWRCSPLIRR